MTKYIFRFKISVMIFSLILSSCVADKGDESETDGNSGELNLEISSNTSSSGVASANFKTSANVSKFSVVAEAGSGKTVRINKLSVSGTDFLNPRGDSVSFADTYSDILSTANAPSRDFDTKLSPPQDVEVSASIEGGQSAANNPILFKITSRTDSNLRSGRLNLNIFYVGTVSTQENTKNAIKSAINIAKDIFSSSAGINLSITEKEISGPTNLPIPTDGSSLYLNNTANAPSPAVNVFIGGDIGGVSGEVLGISASIPGPPVPSLKSAVAISIFTSAGTDGFFDNEDIRILGETIAHESGHYMGLFHPTDFSGSVVANSDPLPDTPGCTFFTECLTNNELITNLMFATPVQDGQGSFVPQNKLTSQQRGVINLYAAVD